MKEIKFKKDVMRHSCGAKHIRVVGEDARSAVVAMSCDKCDVTWSVWVWKERVGLWAKETRKFIHERCEAFREQTAPKTMLEWFARSVRV